MKQFKTFLIIFLVSVFIYVIVFHVGSKTEYQNATIIDKFITSNKYGDPYFNIMIKYDDGTVTTFNATDAYYAHINKGERYNFHKSDKLYFK